MGLIILSILSALFVFFVSAMLGASEFFASAFAIIGFFCPGLYTLEQINKEVKKK